MQPVRALAHNVQWPQMAGSEPKMSDPITEALCADLRMREARGMQKYGVSVSCNPLSRREWLQHAMEEALDLAVYLRRLIDMEDGR